MSQNLSYATQELHKKIENLSVAHDKLCSIVNAQSHMIKILKTFHVEDFRKRKEVQENRKNELLTRNSKTRSTSNNFNRNQSNQLERKSYTSNTNNMQFSNNTLNRNVNNNQNSQQSFDAEYEEMKKQVSFLQSQLTQLNTLPLNTTTSVTSAPVQVASNTTTTNVPAPTTV